MRSTSDERRYAAWRRLIVAYAWSMHRRVPKVPLDDFIQAGAEGLIIAIRRYDRRRGRFVPWAQPIVWWAICDEVKRQAWWDTADSRQRVDATLSTEADAVVAHSVAVERRMLLHQAVRRLPRRQRTALNYSLAAETAAAGWSLPGSGPTLADAMGITAKSFTELVSQAKGRLRREMRQQYDG